MLPSACDLKLTSNEKGWLNAVIFVGMMVGGYGFGGIADVKVLTLIYYSYKSMLGSCCIFPRLTQKGCFCNFLSYLLVSLLIVTPRRPGGLTVKT